MIVTRTHTPPQTPPSKWAEEGEAPNLSQNPLRLSHSPSLLSLPPDILLCLVPHLSYDSYLALRLSHPYFYYSSLLRTDVPKRVQFLRDARTEGLLFPERCGTVRLKSDRDFLENRSVARCVKRYWTGSRVKRHAKSLYPLCILQWIFKDGLESWKVLLLLSALVLLGCYVKARVPESSTEYPGTTTF